MISTFVPRIDKRSQSLILIALLLMKFFGLIIFDDIIGYHYIVVCILLFFFFKWRNIRFPYKKMIILYCISLLLSCIYSNIYNNQPLFKVLGFCTVYLGVLFSFLIIKMRLSSAKIINCLVFLSLLYVFGYILQWLVYPFPIFSVADSDAVSMENYRIRIPGSLCAYFLFFYGINRFIQSRKYKYIIYSTIAFIPIIIMGFRTLTVLSLIFAVLMVGFVTRRIMKSIVYILLFGGLTIGASQIPIVEQKIDEMMDRQNSDQTFDNPDYIRWIAYDYFTNEHFNKPGEKIFGGGVPAGTTSYAKSLTEVANNSGFYWMDLGLIGLTWLIGIPAVIFLVLIYLICAWRCKDASIQFVRFTSLLLVLGSAFTTMELFRSGNILLFSFLLCFEYRYNQEKKLLRNAKLHV